jgi:hypothetical protein
MVTWRAFNLEHDLFFCSQTTDCIVRAEDGLTWSFYHILIEAMTWVEFEVVRRFYLTDNTLWAQVAFTVVTETPLKGIATFRAA